MSYVAVTKPVAGDPTKASVISGLIDNEADLHQRVQRLEGWGDSFESDLDSDGIPDGWSRTLYSGGSAALETTEIRHGAQSWKLTATAGGGYVVALRDAYFPTATGERIEVQWWVKCGSATVAHKVEVLWYEADESYLSASTLYDAESGNPTDWLLLRGQAAAPATARWYRLRVTAGKSGGSVGASVYVDGVEARLYHGLVAITPATKTTGTIAISSDVSSGERPWAAWVFVKAEDAGGDTVVLAGNSVTVWDTSVLGPQSWSGLVPLNADLEYSLTTSADTVTHKLLGYVV